MTKILQCFQFNSSLPTTPWLIFQPLNEPDSAVAAKLLLTTETNKGCGGKVGKYVLCILNLNVEILNSQCNTYAPAVTWAKSQPIY